MARTKPGPLAGDVAGKVGGVVFQGGGGGGRAYARGYPVSRQSWAQRDNRALMARAIEGWAALSAAQREAWARLATTAGGGMKLYVAGWLAQQGASTIVAPTLPGSASRPQACGVRTGMDPLGLWIVGLSRDLVGGEVAVVRVYRQVPATWRRVNRRVQRYVNVAPGVGLGEAVQGAQWVPGADAGRVQRTGSSTAGTTGTLEMWLKPAAVQPDNPRALWWNRTNDVGIYWQRFGILSLWVNNVGTDLGASPATTAWAYAAFVWDAGAGTYKFYLNGVQFGPTVIKPATTAGDGIIRLLGVSNLTRNLAADLGPVRWSSTARTAAEVLSAWNGGVGAGLPVDGWTACRLRCDQVVGGQVLDDSGNARHYAAIGTSASIGPFARLAYAAGERWLNPGVTVIETAVVDPARLLGLRAIDRAAW